MCTGKPLLSKRRVGPIPETPEVRFSQKLAALLPMGVIAPKPVTTARRLTDGPPVLVDLLEDDGRVVSAEANGRGHRDIDPAALRDIGDVVEVALGVGVV